MKSRGFCQICKTAIRHKGPQGPALKGRSDLAHHFAQELLCQYQYLIAVSYALAWKPVEHVYRSSVFLDALNVALGRRRNAR